MDKYFFYQIRARLDKREISQELADRISQERADGNLLQEVGCEQLISKRARWLILGLAPVVIVIGILILAGFLA